jgi:hypothetical protein
MMMSNLCCLACDESFDAEWTFGDHVTCTHCGAEMTTDYEEFGDGDLIGPWPTMVIHPISQRGTA